MYILSPSEKEILNHYFQDIQNFLKLPSGESVRWSINQKSYQAPCYKFNTVREVIDFYESIFGFIELQIYRLENNGHANNNRVLNLKIIKSFLWMRLREFVQVVDAFDYITIEFYDYKHSYALGDLVQNETQTILNTFGVISEFKIRFCKNKIKSMINWYWSLIQIFLKSGDWENSLIDWKVKDHFNEENCRIWLNGNRNLSDEMHEFETEIFLNYQAKNRKEFIHQLNAQLIDVKDSKEFEKQQDIFEHIERKIFQNTVADRCVEYLQDEDECKSLVYSKKLFFNQNHRRIIDNVIENWLCNPEFPKTIMTNIQFLSYHLIDILKDGRWMKPDTILVSEFIQSKLSLMRFTTYLEIKAFFNLLIANFNDKCQSLRENLKSNLLVTFMYGNIDKISFKQNTHNTLSSYNQQIVTFLKSELQRDKNFFFKEFEGTYKVYDNVFKDVNQNYQSLLERFRGSFGGKLSYFNLPEPNLGIHCFCNNEPYGYMVECKACSVFYHSDCINLSPEHLFQNQISYTCRTCKRKAEEIQRQENLRLERERKEKERLRLEALERERQEKLRLERERQEKKRQEKERQENLRLEREKERQANLKLEKERKEKERLEREEALMRFDRYTRGLIEKGDILEYYPAMKQYQNSLSQIKKPNSSKSSSIIITKNGKPSHHKGAIPFLEEYITDIFHYCESRDWNENKLPFTNQQDKVEITIKTKEYLNELFTAIHSILNIVKERLIKENDTIFTDKSSPSYEVNLIIINKIGSFLENFFRLLSYKEHTKFRKHTQIVGYMSDYERTDFHNPSEYSDDSDEGEDNRKCAFYYGFSPYGDGLRLFIKDSAVKFLNSLPSFTVVSSESIYQQQNDTTTTTTTTKTDNIGDISSYESLNVILLNSPTNLQVPLNLQPCRVSYDNFDQYYNIMKPLMLHELVSVIKVQLESIDKLDTAIVKIISMKDSPNNFRFKLCFEQDVLNDVEYFLNDLVVLTNSSTKEQVFAMLTFVSKQKHSNNRIISGNMRLFKSSNLNLHKDIITMKRIYNFSKYVREYDALYEIRRSGLSSYILKPDLYIKNYNQYYTKDLVIDENLLKNLKLDPSQLDVVKASLNQRVTLVSGGPGTGKSKTIISILSATLQMVPNPTILVCAPSSSALDEITKLTLKSGLMSNNGTTFIPNILRIGSLESMDPDLYKVSLAQQQRDNKRISIYFSTLVGAGCNYLSNYLLSAKIDLLIIDEAFSCMESSCLIPLQYQVPRVVLIGDPKQLPPSVSALETPMYQYNRPLIERFKAANTPIKYLQFQYRGHSSISTPLIKLFYSNEKIYNIKESDRSHNFYKTFEPVTYVPLWLSDGVKEEKQGNSFKNQMEIDLIYLMLQDLYETYSETQSMSIGIITPYKYQKHELLVKFQKVKSSTTKFNITIDTIDGFQGVEKDIIFLSTVKVNDIGKLNDYNRMNLALSRARSLLVIVGTSEILSKESKWKFYLSNLFSKPSSELRNIQALKEAIEKRSINIFPKSSNSQNNNSQLTKSQADMMDERILKFENGDEDIQFDSNIQNDIDLNDISVDDINGDSQSSFIQDKPKDLDLNLDIELAKYKNFNSNPVIDMIFDYMSLEVTTQELKQIIPRIIHYFDSIDNIVSLNVSKDLRRSFEKYLREFKNYIFYIYRERNFTTSTTSKGYPIQSQQQLMDLIGVIKCNKTAIKNGIIQNIQKLISLSYPKLSLRPYGSYLSNTDLVDSDIDLSITLVGGGSLLNPTKILCDVVELLRNSNYKISKVLKIARIPLIKFEHQSIEFDISFGNSDAIRNSRLIKAYSRVNPQTYQLLIIVKYWAKTRGISGSLNNYLSSYSWYNLVLFFLQNVQPNPVLPCFHKIIPKGDLESVLDGKTDLDFEKPTSWTLIKLLHEFFRFYIKFDFKNNLISLRKGVISKIENADSALVYQNSKSQIVIEDPIDITFNPAKSVKHDTIDIIKMNFYTSDFILSHLNIPIDQKPTTITDLFDARDPLSKFKTPPPPPIILQKTKSNPCGTN